MFVFIFSVLAKVVTFVGGNITLLFLGPKLLASAIKTAIGEP